MNQSSPTLSPGALIGDKYRIESLIGEGAFGYVYRAYDIRLQRPVAIKELSPANPKLSTTAFDDYRRRFEREARVQAQFNHPRIVHVYELLPQGDAYYLVMEYVDGPSLRDYLREKGPLPFDEAIRLTRQVLDGLTAVHEHPWDIVHRDIKPSNILLTQQGEVKLADFGVAQMSEESLRTLTERLPPGTPLYMAPEQARGEPYLWPQADLFAVGCVLFEMLTGKPYRRAYLRPDMPEWLEEVVERALAKEPEERYESAREMAGAIEEARRRRQEEEARRKKQKEEEARRRRQEEEARRRKQEEEEAKRRRQEEEARRKKQEEERRRRAEARAKKLADLREQAERAAREGRWEEARRAAEGWLEMEEATRAQEILALARLERTPSGLVIATPENLAQLLALDQPPQRVWWEKAGMEFCLVPGGPFPMGIIEEEARRWHEEFGGELDWYLDATPRHTVDLPPYYIGRYPVTQAQYARFVQETGHRVPDGFWSWTKPYDWNRRRKRPPRRLTDHPVVLVSWKDAVAYCRWAGLRLPTEAQWEKAARGTDERLYPWGNEWDPAQCNSAEKWAGRSLTTYEEWEKWWYALDYGSQARTTPVGAYSPAGDSPYGCADMAGNVREWCADWYKGYPGTTCERSEFGEKYRVLRGGSWNNHRLRARSAYRDWSGPGDRGGVHGFRSCLSSTSSL